MGIKLTEAAQQAVHKILESEKKEGWNLRIGVSGGGCAGMNYTMAIEEEKGEEDVVNEVDGITILVDPKSYFYLNNMEIDYVSSMMGSGFKFNNPNASKTCGCGTSFSA